SGLSSTSLMTSAIVGGCLEAMLLFPLDTIKTRLQIMPFKMKQDKQGRIYSIAKHLVQKEGGFLSLYKGFFPFSTQLMIKYFVRLQTFHFFDQHLSKHI